MYLNGGARNPYEYRKLGLKNLPDAFLKSNLQDVVQHTSFANSTNTTVVSRFDNN
jgi:hypothetical protein